MARPTASADAAKRGSPSPRWHSAFLLLFGARRFVRSLWNLGGTDTGVAFDYVLTSQLSPSLNGYDGARATQFYDAPLERLRALPGITSVSYAPILAEQEWESCMSVEGRNPAEGENMQAFMNAFSPGHFETMRIPILEGTAVHGGPHDGRVRQWRHDRADLTRSSF